MSPKDRHKAVTICKDLGLSERRSCTLVGASRSTVRYISVRPPETALRQRMHELADRHRRFDHPRLHVLLRREGFGANHKKTHRLYVEENLQVRKRKKRRRSAICRRPLVLPTRAGQRWSMDFMSDQLSSGRRIRLFNLIDDYTRQCLAIIVDVSINGFGSDKQIHANLMEVADKYKGKGLPEASDNLKRFLENTGKTKKVSREEAREEPFYRDAEVKNRKRFEEKTFLAKSGNAEKINKPLKNLKDGQTISLEDDWDVNRGAKDTYNDAAFGTTKEADDALAKGRKTFKSKTNFTATRRGGKIFIEGTVDHIGDQNYDFEAFDLGAVMGAKRLQDKNRAKPFKIERNWKRQVSGTVDIGPGGRLQNPQFKWDEVD
jgi:hypothetical protein